MQAVYTQALRRLGGLPPEFLHRASALAPAPQPSVPSPPPAPAADPGPRRLGARLPQRPSSLEPLE